MGISVGVANPGKISGVSVANPGRISSVGNASPGKITSVGNANQAPASPAPSPSNPAGLDLNAIARQLAALRSGGGGGGAPPQVYAPKLDLVALSAQARAAATNNVNPYYISELNRFTAQQAAEKATQQKQFDINVKNLQDELANQLQQNETTRTRTGEDVATNEAKIADTADQFQTDSGQQFDVDRLLLAKEQAASGNAGSGLAAGKTAAAQTVHNTTESRQVDKFADQKTQQELFKGRTFEDLTRASEQAKTAEGKGETQAKFDLDKYIQAQGFDLADKQIQLELSRKSQIDTETAKQSRILVNQFINGIADPARRQAALQAYGGAF